MKRDVMHPRKFKCEYCSFVFTQKTNLLRHINVVHLKLKPFQCLSCGKKFGRKYSMQMHYKICKIKKK